MLIEAKKKMTLLRSNCKVFETVIIISNEGVFFATLSSEETYLHISAFGETRSPVLVMNACDQPVQMHTHIISRSIPPLFSLLKRMSLSLCFSVALAVKIVGKRKVLCRSKG